MGEVNKWHALNTLKCLRTITEPTTIELGMLIDLRAKMMSIFISQSAILANLLHFCISL